MHDYQIVIFCNFYHSNYSSIGMGCESSNTVIAAQSQDLSLQRRGSFAPRRVSPVEILISHAARQEVKSD